MSERKICPTCLQEVKQARKIPMDKSKHIMLRKAADHVQQTMVNNFMVSDFTEPAEFKRFNAFATLRYFGLVTQVKVNGKKLRNNWLITRNGWAFLRGEKDVHEFLLIKNNHIDSRSERMVYLRDIYYKPDIIQTNFEYFDDDGKPVGFRPFTGKTTPEQVRLI
jgi:hypothetical protein